ncbi:hypothetical protein D3C80_2187690 [compost metagenome]
MIGLRAYERMMGDDLTRNDDIHQKRITVLMYPDNLQQTLLQVIEGPGFSLMK